MITSSMMNEISHRSGLLGRLSSNAQRGSKPRCHFITHGTEKNISARLTSLIEPWGTVSDHDTWMPLGFDVPEEPQLHRATRLVARAEDRDAMKNWWLANPTPTASTPNWDIASTCSIGEHPGLLLIEAKAHKGELRNEEGGKKFTPKSSRANHERIALAVDEANHDLRMATNFDWTLSSDRCYQMSNRFAWSWKLCTLGYPIVLVYLGFIGANEMSNPFDQDIDWDNAVRQHSAPLFPPEIWNRRLAVHGRAFIPIIRSRSVPLQCFE